jgi:phenylpropionate dioxygenase-like ring-hydroxylating dioxygenase large terminal subunit
MNATTASITPQAVPFAVTQPDRIPKQRYYDKGFYALECEKFWPRVWQMACRLEEIPKRGDYVVYDILDQSIIVVRLDERTIKAYHNACRHRGVQLLKDRGSRPSGVRCPFHGWSWNLNGECTFVFTPELFDECNLDRNDLRLRECRVECWGGCAFINLDDDAPPLRDSIEPFATMHDAWHAQTLRTEWWLSARMPCNWKLAMEAFMEGYHVMQTHPQLLAGGTPVGPGSAYRVLGTEISPPSRYVTIPTEPATSFDPRQFIDANIRGMKMLNVGMAGMTHERDVLIAESIREMELPNDFQSAAKTWNRALNDAVVAWHRKNGMDIPDLNDLYERNAASGVNFCFPHYFILPTWSSAASYRIRPLGPEECLFELWSLTRYPEGEERPVIKTPTPMAPDDPRWPPVPKQDFSNIPRQQIGLHTKGFDYMRLSRDVEGLISNNHRLIDGYLAGLGYDRLLPAAQKVSGRIDVEIKDLGF